MSRIGKMPIIIPDKVEVKIDNNVVTAKGPLGTLTTTIRPEIILEREDNKILVKIPDSKDRKLRALHGLSRTLVNNLVVGVSQGFTKDLEIVGVGYKAQLDGNKLQLQLGYSHPIIIDPPEGIQIKVDGGTKIAVFGPNKQTVGDVAADIRDRRPPEVYKGKGVRYKGEVIRRKAGKAGKK